MDTAALLRKVRKIEIKTRGLSNQIFSGEYHSAFKGRGMTFSEVREYMPGDPIRSIDWNVTARFHQPYVKVFEEEREITLMLLIDVSGSASFGTKNQLKRDMITEVAAVLAFSAVQNNDKVGVILFSDTVEKFIPPKKGKSHILRIIRELIEFRPQGKGTNTAEALRFFTNVCKKRSIAFLVSDMMDAKYERPLQVASKKHDLVCLVTSDPAEASFPSLGLIPVRDAESNAVAWVDTSNKHVRDSFIKAAALSRLKTEDTLKRSGVDFAHLNTAHGYVRPMMQLFKKREARR